MKITTILLIVLASLALSGCASYEGGTTDEYNRGYGTVMNPASPTFHPGMYPQDPRDPNALTRPVNPP